MYSCTMQCLMIQKLFLPCLQGDRAHAASSIDNLSPIASSEAENMGDIYLIFIKAADTMGTEHKTRKDEDIPPCFDTSLTRRNGAGRGCQHFNFNTQLVSPAHHWRWIDASGDHELRFAGEEMARWSIAPPGMSDVVKWKQGIVQ